MTETVKVVIHHGNYREEFTGTGETLEQAVEAAAIQSPYSEGIIPAIAADSQWRTVRGRMYESLIANLQEDRLYAGYGWCTFYREQPEDWAGHPDTPVTEEELARLIAEDERARR